MFRERTFTVDLDSVPLPSLYLHQTHARPTTTSMATTAGEVPEDQMDSTQGKGVDDEVRPA